MSADQQQQQSNTFQAPFQPFLNAGRTVQAIFSELSKISQENIEAGSKATQKLREIRSVPDVVDIHTELVNATIETINAHVPRIAEIAVSAPVEIIKSYQDTYNKLAEAGNAAVQKAGDAARDVAQNASQTARDVADKSWDATREATDKTLEASRQGADKTNEAARQNRR
jgi:hypothetical protein